ncbi:hypothetical protein SY88_06940 [Clostridiales bacterium PH28_bin88]|nr:hypothetical protein SY88_06940 [Clostridiales bacterium PH28_bin88]
MFGLNPSRLKKGQTLWVVVLLLMGMVLLSAGKFSGGLSTNVSPQPEATGKQNQGNGSLGLEMAAVETMLEQRLVNILGQVQGVGNVSVKVFLASGPKYEYATNVSTNKRTVDEKDQSGGSRVTTEYNDTGQLVLVQTATGGGERPVVTKETTPKVQGVLVVADGAVNPRIKESLTRAVETALDIEPHKINVMPGK